MNPAFFSGQTCCPSASASLPGSAAYPPAAPSAAVGPTDSETEAETGTEEVVVVAAAVEARRGYRAMAAKPRNTWEQNWRGKGGGEGEEGR